MIVLASVTILVTLYPGQGLAKFLQLMFDPLNPTKHLDYRLSLLVWVGFNILLCILIEKAIVERRWLKKIVHFFIRKRIPKNKFRVIQMEMDQEGWPYVSPMNCR